MRVSGKARERVIRNFVGIMQATFEKPPQIVDEKMEAAVLREYIESLASFSEAELKAGWRRLRGGVGTEHAGIYRGRSWPAIYQCVEACTRKSDLTQEQRYALRRASDHAINTGDFDHLRKAKAEMGLT